MQYENPEIPEGINTSNEHPLKELVWLLGGVVLVSVIVGLFLVFATNLSIALVPFSYEQEIAAPFVAELEHEEGEISAYLQALAEDMSTWLDLPSDMSLQMHYIDEETVNAFATLGGHIFIYRGLVQAMPSENALAMVVAHEIAHIKQRDPIASLGRGVVFMIAWSLVTGASGSDIGGQALGQGGLLTLLSFSRDQERAADQEAIKAVEQRYGHIAGASALFEQLEKAQQGSADAVPQFFSSHPLNEDRSVDIEQLADAHAWQTAGELTPLPGFVSRRVAE